MLVVVLDVLFEESFELAFVPDDRAVQEFVAKGPNPSFCIGVGLRGAGRDPYGCDVGPCENGVERAGELSGAVSDQEAKLMTVT